MTNQYNQLLIYNRNTTKCCIPVNFQAQVHIFFLSKAHFQNSVINFNFTNHEMLLLTGNLLLMNFLMKTTGNTRYALQCDQKFKSSKQKFYYYSVLNILTAILFYHLMQYYDKPFNIAFFSALCKYC